MSSGPLGWGARVWGARNRQLPSPQVVPKRSPGLDRGQFDRVVITGKADDPRPVSQESLTSHVCLFKRGEQFSSGELSRVKNGARGARRSRLSQVSATAYQCGRLACHRERQQGTIRSLWETTSIGLDEQSPLLFPKRLCRPATPRYELQCCRPRS